MRKLTEDAIACQFLQNHQSVVRGVQPSRETLLFRSKLALLIPSGWVKVSSESWIKKKILKKGKENKKNEEIREDERKCTGKAIHGFLTFPAEVLFRKVGYRDGLGKRSWRVTLLGPTVFGNILLCSLLKMNVFFDYLISFFFSFFFSFF